MEDETGRPENWQSVDSGYDGDGPRRIIVYRADPGDMLAPRRARKLLDEDPQG